MAAYIPTPNSASLPNPADIPHPPFAPPPAPIFGRGQPSALPDSPDAPPDTSEPLRDRAWALHCQGLKAPAISQRLDVPERTIRSWLAADLKETAAERKAKRAERLTLAIERHLAIAAAAWDAYHRAAEYDALALDRLRARHDAPASADDTAAAPLPAHLTAVAARYLNVALAAQREVARLEGLFLPATPETEDAPKSILLTTNDEIMVPPSLLPAWLAFRSWYDEHGRYAASAAAQARAAAAADDPLPGDSLPAGEPAPDSASGDTPAEKSAESAIPSASSQHADPADPGPQDAPPAPASTPSGPPMAPWPTEPMSTRELAARYGPRVPTGISGMTLDELDRYYHTYIPSSESRRHQL